MKKRARRLAGILCCIAMILGLVPEVAKADPGLKVEDISDEAFDYEGGFVEAKYTVTNDSYKNQKATYEWYGSPTDIEGNMTRENANNADTKYFYPPCRLGKYYYYCKVKVGGMEAKSNIFAVTFTSELWDIQVLSEPKQKYYELDDYINFDGVKVRVTRKNLVGDNTTVTYSGNSEITMKLDSKPMKVGDSNGDISEPGKKAFVLYWFNANDEDADADQHADAYEHPDAYQYAYADQHPDAYPGADRDTDNGSHADPGGYRYAYADTDSRGNAYAGAHGYIAGGAYTGGR